MPFAPGQSGNPRGRPPGIVSGRMRALRVLDDMLSQSDNQEALRAAMQSEFERNPLRFFRTVVMPLLPREAVLSAGQAPEGGVKWQSLLETFPLSKDVPQNSESDRN